MKTSEIMTNDPACCKEDQSLQDAARLMVDNDCGQIPVVDDEGGLVGVITDRDVCCRAVAEGMSAETRVGRDDPVGCKRYPRHLSGRLSGIYGEKPGSPRPGYRR